MKRFPKPPSCLAFFASWVLAIPALAQTNTNTFFAELNNDDRRDVAVQTPYTPYGDKTALNRYGDDGSAAMVEASGIVLWRSSDGVYRPLPNSQYAKPLFVSNNECIVWQNAFDPSVIAADPDAPDVLTKDIQINYYRVDSASGVLRDTKMTVEGNKVLDTPSITTTTAPYTMVTANVAELPAATNTQHPAKNLFVYRVGHVTTTPQLLSVGVWSANEYLTDGAETVAVSADGSQVVRLSDLAINSNIPSPIAGQVRTIFVWVRNDGSLKQLFSSTDPFVVAVTTAVAPAVASYGFTGGYFFNSSANNNYPIIRPVEVSAAKFVFGSPRYDLNGTITSVLFNYSRDPVADEVQVQPTITLPFPVTTPASTGEVIPLPNFNQQGVTPVFVTQDGSGNLAVFKLAGNVATFLFKAKIPVALGMDVAITRINATPGSESIALHDASNQGVVWLHNGPGRNLVSGSPLATTNFSLINEFWGRPLFVTPGETLVWTNALAQVQPNGSLPPAVVKHYGRDAATGAITVTEVKVLADATEPNAIFPGPIQGTQVFSPFPFTQDPALWMLETGEKLSGNSLRVRRYQLLTPTNADADGDGIRGGQESGPFFVIPGTFTYEQAVKDAARRGGHLATIADAAELALMQTAISLWQINSPMPLPKLVVPYPLWIGLEGLGASPPYTWQWQDASTAFIATNWAPGEPAAVAGRNRGRLTNTQKWEAANPATGGGYLLELHPTDPLAKDTDGDGASDYDELFRLITDPLVPDFGQGPALPVVPFSDSSVYGNYEGFLTQFSKGPISSFTLSVASNGSYTGRIYGSTGAASIRGSFATNGSVTSLPVSFGNGTSFLSMLIAPRNPLAPPNALTNSYRIGGNLSGLNGIPLVFQLRRAAYSKSWPSPDAGSYTLAMPAANVPKAGQPNGDGYLTGSIASDGRAVLRGKTSDGLALSWSGCELEGDFLSFFSMLSDSSGSVGSNLFLRDTAEVNAVYGLVGQSDIDGDLLVVRGVSTKNAGYAFRSGAYGSLYQNVSYAQLPSFSEFVPTANNTVMKFIDGAFSGQDVIATWTPKNALSVPKTQTRSLKAKIDGKTGTLSGTYYFNDPINGYAKSTASLGGVVLQKSGEVRGYYTAGTSSGQLVLLPNRDGSQAPVTKISPRSKSISEAGGTYKIYVTASEPWTVRVPAGWVNVTPMSGNGNAELIVTVVKNSSNLRRVADLTIAGINHHIEQDYNKTGGSNVTISPVVRTSTYQGSTYTVTVTGGVGLTTEDFSSPVPWVIVTPALDLKSATVTVDLWPYFESGYTTTPRSADVIIGGVTHKVIQTSYYWYWYYY